MNKIKSLAFISFLLLLINSGALAQQQGSLSGQVYDSLGAVVIGANVIAVDANSREKSAITNRDGAFAINGLAPGAYTVRVVAPKFALYEQTDVQVAAGGAMLPGCERPQEDPRRPLVAAVSLCLIL